MLSGRAFWCEATLFDVRPLEIRQQQLSYACRPSHRLPIHGLWGVFLRSVRSDSAPHSTLAGRRCRDSGGGVRA